MSNFVNINMEQRYYPQNKTVALAEVREGLLSSENTHYEAEDTADAAVATDVEADALASTATTTLTTLLQLEARYRRNETCATLASSGEFLVSMLWLARQTGSTEALAYCREGDTLVV